MNNMSYPYIPNMSMMNLPYQYNVLKELEERLNRLEREVRRLERKIGNNEQKTPKTFTSTPNIKGNDNSDFYMV